ncbi:6-phosphofructo-2-kinase-domain-containing protein [Sporodiniella umbellata]|nr:6-phosphofructo-2-kinase-domain-containing protein [Sporodiniella umbellata]
MTNFRLACVMVGLPGRGKTYIAQKVCRYLQWLDVATKVFNVGNYRRQLFGSTSDHGFFDLKNATGQQQRKKAANVALEEMIGWFEAGGTVGIYDATNSTAARRRWISDLLTKHDIQVVFVESVCEDELIVMENVQQMKLGSPDYNDRDPAWAVEDYKQRMCQYKDYEPVTVSEGGYVKLINAGSQVMVNMVRGYLESRIVYYLMNLHTQPRKIYMSRHGESMFNLHGKIGGDSDLSPRGQMYAKRLPGLVREHLGDKKLVVWTSSLKRTKQTSAFLDYPKMNRKPLDEINAGVCDGMTYEEIELKFPEDYANRDTDKFNYRYKGGESYRDVVLRLEPIIMDLERQGNILIIGHQAILRCIYAYFMNYNQEDLPYIKIPLHTVIELSPKAYGCDERRYKVDIEAVDTHRPKPTHKAQEIKPSTNNPILPIRPEFMT